jgi:ring-1,2-phenylacetyl-CoA epoxidase subunit PaaC
MQRACDDLWRYTGELFEPLEGLGAPEAAGSPGTGTAGPAETAATAETAGGGRPPAGSDGSTGSGGAAGVAGPDWAALEADWLEAVVGDLEAATLTVPKGPRGGAWTAGAGRRGVHTESFGRMLAEMQHLHRSHPGATW